MSEILLLGGKVSKQSLPEVLPPSGPGGPALKRLMLPQGELAQLWDADEGMRYLAFIELKAGTVRGNHYHKNKEEWVYMMSGQVRLVVEEVDSKKREEVNIKKGDLVFIRTGVAHAL